MAYRSYQRVQAVPAVAHSIAWEGFALYSNCDRTSPGASEVPSPGHLTCQQT